MRSFTWMCDVIRLNKVGNKLIKEIYGVMDLCKVNE